MDADSSSVFLLDSLFSKAKTEQDGIRGHREGVWRVVEGGLGSLGWVEGGGTAADAIDLHDPVRNRWAAS